MIAPKRIGGDRRIRQAEPDRDQDAPDRAVRADIGINKGADPHDDGDRHGERQQDEKSGKERTEAADHRTPSAKASREYPQASLFGGLVGYRVLR